MSKDTKKYHLLKDMINWSTGHVIPKGEEFIQLQGTRKYQSLNGWQMSESACLNKEWFKEVLPEQPKQQEERIEINGNRVHYELGENGVPNIISIKGYLFYPATNAQKTYTQSEVDTIREETFRDGYFKGWYNGCFEKDKTISNKVTDKAFEEYNNNAKNKPTPNKEQGSKEWEILSYFGDIEKWKLKDVLVNKLPNGKWVLDFRLGHNEPFDENIIPKKLLKIHSVRRTSDGEVFSLGDEVTYKDAHYLPYIIENFFVKEDKILARSEGNNYCEFVDDSLIKKPKDKEQVLFTTEDGVDIRSGETTWVLSTNNWRSSPTRVPENGNPYKGVTGKEFKYFSSYEAVEQYILENKPCLSANDIKWWLEKYFDYPNGINVNQLHEQIKQKLNQH